MSVWLLALGWVVGLFWLALCILATIGFIAILVKVLAEDFRKVKENK